MADNVLIYFSLFTSLLTGAFTIYFFILRKKVNKRNSEKVEISGQRERIESRIYGLNEIMLSDPERLFDNTKLLLQFPNKELTTSHNVPNYSFFQSLGIDISNIFINDKTVFCLMPFHKTFNKIYDTVLLKSQLIIAILDGKNPNVFYEIGIAHSIGKTVILIANSDKINDIPFDLRSDRLLLYSGYNDLNKKLSEVLKNIHYVE